ncbi:5-deoxy-glucuronate isomerase [Kineosphaera limosa]|uniref:5-deoxy-glucuronate isomerase n=1 Tax=Kineosphaera limosa NBRC 100340 TaxID=1184609 RepID=K6W656_9MICO|nr:5-deoxy-glucuronate isomerase [Kineosphaera limosa]NYE01068.1 5-deoxy-glucuronate isomerase [Kineosphaera limosa]GAB94665.1 5-deoxy-glucuronate isomerase [Kineosphaera limosa NBRC 100340]
MSDNWILPFGAEGDSDYPVAIRPGRPGWAHTGLLVADLADGESRTIETGADEYLVLVLSGGDVQVECGEHSDVLAGRANVFAGPADVAYIPRNSTVTVTSTGGGRVAFPFARAKADVAYSVVRAADIPVELRGAGQASRQVQNFGTPGTLEASSIIACEVITPAGNWSSYPPHKHDEHREGVESELEEIYYFEMRAIAREASLIAQHEASGEAGPSFPGGTRGAEPPERGGTRGAEPPERDPFGVQFVYGTDERPIDVKASVRSGDVVLVPHGWHGPAMTPPGYDMYYLNVMAGPGAERVWLICDDPAHGWVRQTWDDQPIDPRLPLRG